MLPEKMPLRQMKQAAAVSVNVPEVLSPTVVPADVVAKRFRLTVKPTTVPITQTVNVLLLPFRLTGRVHTVLLTPNVIRSSAAAVPD